MLREVCSSRRRSWSFLLTRRKTLESAASFGSEGGTGAKGEAGGGVLEVEVGAMAWSGDGVTVSRRGRDAGNKRTGRERLS
jgi:hypothetical protein